MIRTLAAAFALIAAPASAADLSPLDFLVGHCWQGTLPNGDSDTHCFKASEGKVTDHHDVARAGKTFYGGDTEYRVESGKIVWAYKDGDDGVMTGSVSADPDGLDFGTATYEGQNGTKIVIATRWVRLDARSYEARDVTISGDHPSRVTKYARVD